MSDMLTPAQAAILLKTSPGTVRNMIKQDLLTAKRVGNRTGRKKGPVRYEITLAALQDTGLPLDLTLLPLVVAMDEQAKARRRKVRETHLALPPTDPAGANLPQLPWTEDATSEAPSLGEGSSPVLRLLRTQKYRHWADYGPPPLLPTHPPTPQEVRKALRQRRMSPTQNNVLQYMLELVGAQSWCYFSTVDWMNALAVARTQLLRARRELIEQHLIYYQTFPPELEATYVDQVGNGWIGFYPPGEWLPRTRLWGGIRKGAGRPGARAGVNVGGLMEP